MRRLAGLLLGLTLGWAQAHADTADESEPQAVESQQEQQQEETPPQPTLAEIEAMRVALAGRNQQARQRLQQQYPQEFIELPGQDESFAALFSPANAHRVRGQIIFLPELHQPADAPGALALLRYAVNDKGWHSLSLHLPDPDFIALHVSPLPQPEPVAELAADELSDELLLPTKQADEQQLTDEQDLPEPEPEPELEPEVEQAEEETIAGEPQPQPLFADRFAAQLDAALVHGDTKPVMLLAAGQSAGLLLEYLQWQPQQSSKIAHMVLLEPRQYEAGKPIELLIEQSSVPVTEFYSAAHKWQQDQARQRLNAGKRKRKGEYRQIRLDAAFPDQAEQANRRIVGWLYKNQQKFQ